MTGSRVWRLPGLAVCALLLAACSTVPPTVVSQAQRQALYETRSDGLKSHGSWLLQGRLAVRNDDDGGSGTFRWRVEPGASRMDFHGALGRGAWRLVADGGGATLDFADGARYYAATVGELVSGQVGWKIPVDSLTWWVRGLAAPERYRQRLLDERGHLERLEQGGWVIEYGRYTTVDGLDLPTSVTARQRDRVVKLAVKDWQFPSATGGGD